MYDLKHTKEDLAIMQNWTLERKIRVSQLRIMEWYERHGGACSISFSGGKDSTLLLWLARRIYPDIEAVYVDAGLDYPEVRKFAASHDNVTVIRPEIRFDEAIQKFGWCYPSKDVAKTIYYARRGSPWAVERMQGINPDGTPSPFRRDRYAKWAFLQDSDFVFSDKCCYFIKEKPMLQHQRRTGKFPIVGTLAAESRRRTEAWYRTGCNAFDAKNPVSKPLSFWRESEILYCLKEFNIPYASVYGDIVTDTGGRIHTKAESRTGCIFCPVGCHLDKVNRFERLARTHPKLHDYCINTLELGKLLDFAGVPYN